MRSIGQDVVASIILAVSWSLAARGLVVHVAFSGVPADVACRSTRQVEAFECRRICFDLNLECLGWRSKNVGYWGWGIGADVGVAGNVGFGLFVGMIGLREFVVVEVLVDLEYDLEVLYDLHDTLRVRENWCDRSSRVLGKFDDSDQEMI